MWQEMWVRHNSSQTTIIVIIGYLAATLTGFLRQSQLAFHLGADRVADVYLVAFALPEFFFIALPIVLGPAIIPLFAQVRTQQGEQAASRFGLKLVFGLVIALAVLSVVVGFTAPLYVPWLSPGFTPAEQARAVEASRWMMPSIFFMGLATLASAILQVYRSFTRPAFVTAVYNLVFVAALYALPFSQPLQRAVWGVLLGAVASLLVQVPLLARFLFAQGEQGAVVGQDLPGLAKVWYLAGPLAAGYAVHHLILFIDRAMATTLGAGDAAALSYADKIALVIVQISGLAVSTILFPSLAEQVERKDFVHARAALSSALRLVWIIAVPAAAGLIVVRQPLVRFLLERGAFDSSSTASVSMPLAVYALAALADALCQPLWRFVYAQRSRWTVLSVNGFQTIIRLIFNLILLQSMGITGLALSALIGLAAQAVLLGWLASSRLGLSMDRPWRTEAFQVVLASAASALLAWAFIQFLPALSSLKILLLSGVAAVVVYVAGLRLMNIPRRILHGFRTI